MIDPEVNALAPADPVLVAALTAIGEASDQGLNGMQAVINSGQNRALDGGWWGDDLRGVFLDHEQYDCWMAGPDRDRILAMSRAEPVFQQALGLARLAVAGTLRDITNGADSYYAETIPAPNWVSAPETVFTVQIGAHRYYRTRPRSPALIAAEEKAGGEAPPVPIPI